MLSRKLNPSTTGRDSPGLKTLTNAGTVASVDTGPMSAGLRDQEAAEEVALLPEKVTAKIGLITEIIEENNVGTEEMEAEDTLARTKEEADRAVTRVIIAIISEATGTAPDLQDAITIDNPVIVTRETELTAETSGTTEEKEEEIEESKDAAEALLTDPDPAPEAPTTEEDPRMMGVLLNSSKVSVSTATRKVTSGITAPNLVAPEKEAWTEEEIIEIIAHEEETEEAAEAETAEATLLGNSPGADLPAPPTNQENNNLEEVVTMPDLREEQKERTGIKAMAAKNKVNTTVNPKAGEGITVLNRDLDRPEEDATSTKAMTENECDD